MALEPAAQETPLQGAINSRGPITEAETFEIHYRVSKGETPYAVAKSLGLSAGAVSRVINGDVRAGRTPRPPFAERLSKDLDLKLRFDAWIAEKEMVFEGRHWTRREFRTLPIIRRWEEAIRLRGSPSMMKNIAFIEGICTGGRLADFRCDPKRFTLDLDLSHDSPVRTFVAAYLKETGKTKIPQHLSIAIRDFLATCQGVVLPRNFGGTFGLSGMKDFYGKHNTKMLTTAQWLSGLKLLLQRGDLRLAAKMAVGCEAFPRSETLDFLRPSSFREVRRDLDGHLCTYYVCEKFEKKTAKHRPTPFIVEIIHPLAVEITRRYLEVYRPAEAMFADGLGQWVRAKRAVDDNTVFKQIYKELGITDPYYFSHATYTFRHTGARRWVRRCGGNYSRVAKRGWLDDKTLKDCYAGQDDEDDFEAQACYQCKPPRFPTLDDERFCGLKCAAIYYSVHREEILEPYLPLLSALGRRAA